MHRRRSTMGRWQLLRVSRAGLRDSPVPTEGTRTVVAIQKQLLLAPVSAGRTRKSSPRPRALSYKAPLQQAGA